MALSARDYGRLAAIHLDEPVWRAGLIQPAVPELDEMQAYVEQIHEFQGYPTLKLMWLPDHKVVRKGIQQPAVAVWMEDVNNQTMELVPLPRFGVLQRIPPEAEIAPGWTLRQEWEREANEWFATYGQAYLHELPPEGLYKEMPGGWGILSKHKVYEDGEWRGHSCCYRKLAEEQTCCYGEIFLPTWRMVESVERGWTRFMQGPQRRYGTEAASYEEKAAVVVAGNRTNQAAKNKVWDDIGEGARQNMTSTKYRDPKLFSTTSLVPGVAQAAARTARKKTSKEL